MYVLYLEGNRIAERARNVETSFSSSFSTLQLVFFLSEQTE